MRQHLRKQAIPGSDLVVIDNCGHSPQVEKPDEFIKTALEYNWLRALPVLGGSRSTAEER